MTTFKELLQERGRLLQERAVYEHLIAMLEGSFESDEVIQCESGDVHPDVLQKFIDNMTKTGLDVVNARLDELENYAVVQMEAEDVEEEEDAEEGDGTEGEGEGSPEVSRKGFGGAKPRKRRAHPGRGKAVKVQLKGK